MATFFLLQNINRATYLSDNLYTCLYNWIYIHLTEYTYMSINLISNYLCICPSFYQSYYLIIIRASTGLTSIITLEAVVWHVWSCLKKKKLDLQQIIISIWYALVVWSYYLKTLVHNQLLPGNNLQLDS